MSMRHIVKTDTRIVEISPTGSMYLLSQLEVNRLRDASQGGLLELFRRCALAVLNSGELTDDAEAVLERYRDFKIEIIQQTRGLKLRIENAPESAFVDGEVIKGIQENLFAVLRDVVYTDSEIIKNAKYDLTNSASITDAVFHILRNAGILDTRKKPGLIVCWGGHSIGRDEYDFTKEVGYQLGLRGLDICTGCGAGADRHQRRERHRDPFRSAWKGEKETGGEIERDPCHRARLRRPSRGARGNCRHQEATGRKKRLGLSLGILRCPRRWFAQSIWSRITLWAASWCTPCAASR